MTYSAAKSDFAFVSVPTTAPKRLYFVTHLILRIKHFFPFVDADDFPRLPPDVFAKKRVIIGDIVLTEGLRACGWLLKRI
jgi:hypothetical protein